MPLHDLLPRADGHQARRQNNGRCFSGFRQGDRCMSTSSRIPKQIEEALLTHRRDFLRSAGMLAVSLTANVGALASAADAPTTNANQEQGPYPVPDFRKI